MTDDAPVEITLRGVEPMDEVVQHVRSRARAVDDELSPPDGWAVLVEASWPHGVRVYRCVVAYVQPGRCVDAECADPDLFTSIDRAFAGTRRALIERWGRRDRSRVRIRVRPGRRADESSQSFPL